MPYIKFIMMVQSCIQQVAHNANFVFQFILVTYYSILLPPIAYYRVFSLKTLIVIVISMIFDIATSKHKTIMFVYTHLFVYSVN